MVLEGVDIASHQGDYTYPTNPDFAIIKASGGHDYRNPYLARQVANARAKNIIVGFYHYQFEPTSGGGDVKREAANFIEACRPHVQPGSTFWLDVEEYPKSVGFTGDLTGWIFDFCEAVESAFGCVCGIYCATWYLTATGLDRAVSLTKYPFWMASWQPQVPPAKYMAPWDRLTIHQYNADGIDKDRFFGTREQFLALGVPAKKIDKKQDTGSIRAYINDQGATVLEIVYGGEATAIEGVNIVDAGVSVRNAAGEVFDRSVFSNVFQPWRKRGAQ